jgi:glutaredoxin 3
MKIITYTIPTSPWCEDLKAWLKSNKIKYEDRDLAESQNKIFRDEMLEKSGQLAVPVIDIEGKILIGFDEKDLKKALAL